MHNDARAAFAVFLTLAGCGPGGVLVIRADGGGSRRDGGGGGMMGGDTGLRPDAPANVRDSGATVTDSGTVESRDSGAGTPDSGIPMNPRDAGFADATSMGQMDAGNVMPRPDGGPRPPPRGSPYAHAAESAHDLRQVLHLTGNYGVALGGGHLLAGDSRGGSRYPRETPVSSRDQIAIPAGATVRHAFLWYSGVIFMRPHSPGRGDYTNDVGGALDTASDVQQNGIAFSIDGTRLGPFDVSSRRPPNPSSIGSESQISPLLLEFTFGTLTGTKETVWANRLDVTGQLTGRSGTIEVSVEPPERLDVNGNDAANNGGNPAGLTTHNLCIGAASWSIMVIYEKSDLPRRDLVLMDGGWARAWDYLFFHSGQWQRPKVRINHPPIQHGAKFYVYAPSSSPAGSALPADPSCSCGCGGHYTLRRGSGLSRNAYFSDTHVDPPPAANDPIHRDRTNGPWYVNPGGRGAPAAGNDWTLFQSADVYTELPNLFEGESAPAADTRMPATNEDDPDSARDTYAGHPWAGRAAVSYHASGNAISVVEVVPDASAIVPGETSSYLYFKGDQKDVFKPQQVVAVKYVLFETPVP